MNNTIFSISNTAHIIITFKYFLFPAAKALKQTITKSGLTVLGFEYLSAYSDIFTTTHSTIAETCFTHLNSRQVKQHSPYHLPEAESLPFLKYSLRKLRSHAKRVFSNCGMSLALELLSGYEDHIFAISPLTQSQTGYDFCSSSLVGFELCMFCRDR